jgi:RimJ/RimL family protein N-acetyltransferase
VLVGGCEVHVRASGLATVSYWTFPLFRRRGYASRATRLLCDWAFAELGLDRIELHAEEDNVGSRGVARRAGFSDTGRRNRDGLLVYERRA